MFDFGTKWADSVVRNRVGDRDEGEFGVASDTGNVAEEWDRTQKVEEVPNQRGGGGGGGGGR